MARNSLIYIMIFIAIVLIGIMLIISLNNNLNLHLFTQPDYGNNAHYTFVASIPKNFAPQSVLLEVDGNRYSTMQLPNSSNFSYGTMHNYSYTSIVTNYSSSGNVSYIFKKLLDNCGLIKISGSFNAVKNCTITAVYYENSTSSSTTTTSATTTSSSSTTLNTTTIIGKVNTTFYENGLPQNATFQVTFANITKSTSNKTLSFLTLPGNYSFDVFQYNVTNTLKYLPTPANGTIIAGSLQNVSFRRLETNSTYYLSVSTSPLGSGMVSPQSGQYTKNSIIRLSEVPKNGLVFKYWSGTGAGSYSGLNPNETIILTENITETATFGSTFK